MKKKKVAVHKKNIANSRADFLAKMGAKYMIEFYI
jgi:ribonuclease HI